MEEFFERSFLMFFESFCPVFEIFNHEPHDSESEKESEIRREMNDVHDDGE